MAKAKAAPKKAATRAAPEQKVSKKTEPKKLSQVERMLEVARQARAAGGQGFSREVGKNTLVKQGRKATRFG